MALTQKYWKWVKTQITMVMCIQLEARRLNHTGIFHEALMQRELEEEKEPDNERDTEQRWRRI